MSKVDKSGISNLPESLWLVRSKGSPDDDWLLPFFLLSLPNQHSASCSDNIQFNSVWSDVRWTRLTLWSRPAQCRTWLSSATKSSTIRLTLMRKNMRPRRFEHYYTDEPLENIQLMEMINSCLRPAECVQVAHRLVKVREVLGWLVQRDLQPLSGLQPAQTPAAGWWVLNQQLCTTAGVKSNNWILCSAASPWKGIDRLDRDLTIGQMQGDLSITL